MYGMRPKTTYLKKKGSLSLLRTRIKRQPSRHSQGPNFVQEENNNDSTGKQQFKFLHPIGKGGFGRVWKVQCNRSKRLLALKEMLKQRILNKRSVHSVMNERMILSELQHPFIVNIHTAFQDRDNLYLVLDLKSGGDLRYHLAHQRHFSEEQVRFLIACLVTGLEYLHINRIIHRDIKPENLVLDDRGYLHITDFGVANFLTPKNAKDTSGTPGYMAPEVLMRQNHGIEADYFAVGVILYELMMGQRPYIGRDRKEIREHVLSRQVQIKASEVPGDWSCEAVDFCNLLIQRKSSRRLGVNGPHELKSHPWLKNFPWVELLTKQLQAPFMPRSQDNFDPRVTEDWLDELNLTPQGIRDELFEGYELLPRVTEQLPFIHQSIVRDFVNKKF